MLERFVDLNRPSMRALIAVAVMGLAGCSLMGSLPQEPDDPARYVPPNPPTRPAELSGVAKAAKEEGLKGALEISDLRASDFGPGRWMICLRGERDSKLAYFGVYFENEDYKGVRLSVIGEGCENATYAPTGPLPDQSPPTITAPASRTNVAKRR
jgi:hypothetical protein